MDDKPKVDALKAAIESYNKGNLTKDELQAIAAAAGRKVDIWEKATQRHPHYPEGKEESRIGFTFDPQHPKGKFFEKFIKKVAWKSIEYIHKKMLKYDENIFVFDDARLAACQDFGLAFIASNASHSEVRSVLYSKALNIWLGLQKEDLRYRALFFHGFNEFVKVYNKFELTPAEKDNIKRWK